MIEHFIARILGFVGRSQLRNITSSYAKLEKDARTAADNIRAHIQGNEAQMRRLMQKRLSFALENNELSNHALQAEKLAAKFADFAK